jgi:hypothetical protein
MDANQVTAGLAGASEAVAAPAGGVVASEVAAPTQSLEGAITSAVAAAEQTAAPVAAVPEAVPAPPGQSSDWQGVRDFAKAMGVELPYENDAAALTNLLAAYQGLQRRDWYSDLGQRLAPHADKIAAYLAEQEKPKAPEGPPAWRAPEIKREWLQMVERDEATGVIRSKAGYDPSIADKVQSYVEWRERFSERPDEVLTPWVEQRAWRRGWRSGSRRRRRSRSSGRTRPGCTRRVRTGRR